MLTVLNGRQFYVVGKAKHERRNRRKVPKPSEAKIDNICIGPTKLRHKEARGLSACMEHAQRGEDQSTDRCEQRSIRGTVGTAVGTTGVFHWNGRHDRSERSEKLAGKTGHIPTV
jgi:hypothetical protein